jgi:phage recombination protein Bet
MHHNQKEIKMSETKAMTIQDAKGQSVTITAQDVKNYICPKATDKEVFMFLNIAQSYQLNPFKREIHLVKYENAPASFIVGYESYLKRAEHTGKLDGWKAWLADDGKKAYCKIWRKDHREAFEWEVDRAEFDTQKASWKKMPGFMLKKVCIAQAFRLAFPEDLGGMPYIAEEITNHTSGELPQDDIPVVNEPADDTAEPPSQESAPDETPSEELTLEEQYEQRKQKIMELVTKRTIKASMKNNILDAADELKRTAGIERAIEYIDQQLWSIKNA